LSKANVRAIVDEDVGGARKKAKLLGLDASVYSNIDEALSSEKIDVVDICVPTPHHPRFVRRAIEARKHVFCEKPFAATAKEADTLATLAENAGITMQIGQCIRFWPEYQALEKYVKRGAGGKLLSLSLFRRSGRPAYSVGNWINQADLSGGGAFDLHIHDTDYVLHLLGKPKAVTAVGTKDPTGWSHLFTTYHFDDIAVTAEGGWNYPAKWGFRMGFEAIFENAVVEFDSSASPTLMVTEKSRKKRPLAFAKPTVKGAKATGGNISSLGGYLSELRYFIDCLEQKKKPEIATPRQAAESVRTVLAEIKSAETGRSVAL